MTPEEQADVLENVANIAGLGARLRKIPAQHRAKAYGAVQTALRSKTTSKSQAAFALKAHELDPSSIKKIQSGQARLERTSLYINKQVTAATVEVLNNPPTKAEGVTNFDDGKAPFDVLVDTITLKAGNVAGANVDAAEYYNVADLGVIPSYYQNSEIEITCNGRTILPPTKMGKFFSAGSAGMVTGHGDVSFKLNSPQFIKSGEKPQITVRPGANAAIYAANNSFLSVDLEGLANLDK